MRFTSLVIALAATTVTACADVGPDPIASFAGQYTLTRLDGAAVPVVAERTATTTYEVVSGTLTLTADGNWLGVVHSRWADSSGSFPQDNQASGTFFISGNGLTFLDTDHRYYSAAVKADTITAIYEGNTFEFVKR